MRLPELQDYPIEVQEKFKLALIEETKRVIIAHSKEKIRIEYDSGLTPIIKTKSTDIKTILDTYSGEDILDPEGYNHGSVGSGSVQKRLFSIISLKNGDVCRVSITIEVYHSGDLSDFSFKPRIYYMSLITKDGYRTEGRASGKTLSEVMENHYPKLKKAHLKSLLK